MASTRDWTGYRTSSRTQTANRRKQSARALTPDAAVRSAAKRFSDRARGQKINFRTRNTHDEPSSPHLSPSPHHFQIFIETKIATEKKNFNQLYIAENLLLLLRNEAEDSVPSRRYKTNPTYIPLSFLWEVRSSLSNFAGETTSRTRHQQK